MAEEDARDPPIGGGDTRAGDRGDEELDDVVSTQAAEGRPELSDNGGGGGGAAA